MWSDERGSEVLSVSECQRLLALAAGESAHGHLGVADDLRDAPSVLPVNYVVDGHDLVIRVGEEFFGRVAGKAVAFQVDGTEGGRPWSVLVRGFAQPTDLAGVGGRVPVPRVAYPGRRIVRIRPEEITGRRLVARSRA